MRNSYNFEVNDKTEKKKKNFNLNDTFHSEIYNYFEI